VFCSNADQEEWISVAKETLHTSNKIEPDKDRGILNNETCFTQFGINLNAT